MGERTSHPPGTVSWADLITRDLDAAKRFYADLFPWEYEDLPVGDGQIYSMARVGGLDVAALSATAEQPPHWNVYVTVEAADAAAARAAELGAKVLAEPFDVLDAGRMAVIQDPTGAVLSAWEPRANIGARLVNATGALTWADILTPDPDAAIRFYGDWLGWTTDDLPGAEGYVVLRNGERATGGLQPLLPDTIGADVPPSWTPYFGTEDLDAARARVDELGGHTLVGPIDIPVGRFAVLSDPEGAVFAMWAGQYDD